MAVEFLVRARSHKIYKTGSIAQTVKESPAVWGRKETLPDFIRVTVTDATKEDIAKYNQQWIERFLVKDYPVYIEIERADSGRINRINTNSEKVEKAKEAFQHLGLRKSDLTLVDGNIQVSKESGIATLENVQNIVTDLMEDMHKHRRYHVKIAVIDNLVSKGIDNVTITLAQLESNLVDGLD